MLQPVIIVISDSKELPTALENALQAPLYSSESKISEPCCPYCALHQEKEHKVSPAKVKHKKRKKTKKKTVKTGFMNLEDDDVLYDITHACERLGICRSSLASLRDKGHITDRKMGKRGVRFSGKQVESVRLWYSIPKGKV